MLAYKDAIHINSSSSEVQLVRAGEALVRCENVVILDGLLALRPEPKQIVCEVIDPEPLSHRCAEEFAVLLENAQRALATSMLAGKIPERIMEWQVVEDHADGTIELWRPGRLY